MNFRRLPLLAAALVLSSLVTACADPMAPSAAKRSGYITSSSAVQAAPTNPAPAPTPTNPTKKVPENTVNSGYNVTAF